MLSVVVLTRNEEKNIERCIKSLAWCDELIVVDDYSDDETIKKVKNEKLKMKNMFQLDIFKRHLNGDFSAQRNFGLEKAKGEWVLFVDADEEVSDELSLEIKTQISKLKSQNQNSKLKTDQIVGFYVKRQDYFLGRRLKYGETASIRLLRLAKKGAGKWRRAVHEQWEVGVETLDLKSPLLHYPHSTLSEFLTGVNFYSSLYAKELFGQGKKVNFREIFSYPLGKFFQNYILRRGLLDGMPGLVMAITMSFHSFLVRGKLYLLNKYQVSTQYTFQVY